MDILEALQALRDNGLSDDNFDAVLDDLLTTSHFVDHDDDVKRRLVALAFFRDHGNNFDPGDIHISAYNDKIVCVGGEEHLILTDDEATERCKDYIEDTLWAFNSQFLSGETDLDEDIFEALQARYENANKPIRSLIDSTCGFDDFAESAISADGRGHFLNHYDGEEREQSTEAGWYFIYQQG